MGRYAGIVAALLLVRCGNAPDQSGAGEDRHRAAWDRAVVSEVLGMEVADQAVRQRAIALMQAGPQTDTLAFKQLVAEQDSVDRANTARLKAIVDEHGWPSKPLVGEEVAGAAFLIVQHATHDLVFQKEYLAFLEQEHEAGRVSGEPVALLTDRTRQAEGRPQLYGTQMNIEDGRLVVDSIENEDRVDERRAALGLPPLTEYVERVKEAYGLPD